MMRNGPLAAVYLLLFCLPVCAQEHKEFCGTIVLSDEWENEFQGLMYENFSNEKGTVRLSNNYTIPVVFHIIHGGEPIGTYPNVLQGQISSQMTILNQDFAGNAYNASNYPLTAFVNWAINQNIPLTDLDQNGRVKIADVGIQFCLATQDTNGNALPEPGIDRINYLSLGLPSPSSFTSQATMKTFLDSLLMPRTIWDVTRYLNVWLTDKNSALTYAGVSSLPPLSGLMGLPNNATDSTDGIWCYTQAVGSYTLFPGGSYISPFIDGRTLTHEAGHYLGLRHVWGDSACGNDFCNDTPPATAQNTGTPIYPHNVGSCASPSNNPDGEMFMNFMDYTRGPVKYMFTTDQKVRVHTVIQNSPFRNQLGTHGLCSAIAGVQDGLNERSISVYPNPAASVLHVSDVQNVANEVLISTMLGQVVLQVANKNCIDISDLPTGIYLASIRQGGKQYTQKFIKE